MTDFWDRLQRHLDPLRRQLLEHPVYDRMATAGDVRLFMEYHVFAVWDFMSLLKALQQRLTCVAVPWLPPDSPFAARLVNEIVLAEETDTAADGTPASHYQLYLNAMTEAGAEPKAIEHVLSLLSRGMPVRQALAEVQTAEAVRQFVGKTFDVIDSQNLPSIAAAFTFGREDLLPGLFSKLVAQVNSQADGALSAFLYYLDRHVALDGDQHGPMAHKLMMSLCGDDEKCWARAEQAAVMALEARIALWDAMSAAMSPP